MNANRDADITIPDYQSSGLSGPARVGFELRGVRERLGWKLPDLAARLKIRQPFLEAIEAGDLAALPAPAYAAGFIRTYAETMGLDPDEILRRFRAEGMTKPKQPHLTFPEPVPDRAVPPGAIVFLVAVIGIGAYFLWYRHSEHELKMAQMVPSVPAKLAPLAMPKPASPVPAPHKVATNAPPAAPVSTATPAAATPAAATPSSATQSSTAQSSTAQPSTTQTSTEPSSAPAATAAATPPSGGQSAVTNPPAAASAVAPATTTTTQPATVTSPAAGAATAATTGGAPPTNPLVISATADSWVQVQGPHGTILFSRVLKAGETWPVPDEPGLTLTTGNAGGTTLVRNGVTGAPLGNAGSVLRKLPLTPATPPAASTTMPASVPASPADSAAQQ